VDLRDWDERYRSGDLDFAPTALVVEAVGQAPPGKALDLACGAGRNALWLAERGWTVTAVDGSPVAIDILLKRALNVEAIVADLEKAEYSIDPSSWDLITICYYLQRDLFEPAKRGVKPGGLLIAIVHITEPDEEPTYKRLKPGELETWFDGWEIVHRYEGKPRDPSHKYGVSEIVARRPAKF